MAMRKESGRRYLGGEFREDSSVMKRAAGSAREGLDLYRAGKFLSSASMERSPRCWFAPRWRLDSTTARERQRRARKRAIAEDPRRLPEAQRHIADVQAEGC